MANAREPVTLVRSPTLTKTLPGCGMTTGSRPDSLVSRGTAGMTRGVAAWTVWLIARTWAGVVPQQPPTMLTRPSAANARSADEVSAAVSS